MEKIVKVLMVTVSLMASCSTMADRKPYKTVTLDGYNNTIPGGGVYNETMVASGGVAPTKTDTAN
ncbi:hypothetical protein [Pectobacterium odoriferum]|uniref:hypothetical protein n=1 Tax=Pectobacterium odoriferum TaxID=78398 RepID=UPI000CD0B683|nr:hypothetical protein [Pectobacterium odoriferum]